MCVLLRKSRARARLAQRGRPRLVRAAGSGFFGPAPANVDPRPYAPKPRSDCETRPRSGLSHCDEHSAAWTRAARNSGPLPHALRREDPCRDGPPQYRDTGGKVPGPNGELFDFANWTMREHPGWTAISDIDRTAAKRRSRRSL